VRDPHALPLLAQRCECPAADDAAFVQCQRCVLAHACVQRFGGGDFLRARRGAHRMVAAARQRIGIGPHPVVVAILAPVLDQPAPRAAALERRPHVADGLGGHVGVPHQVVRLAHQLLACKTGDADEGVVGVLDAPLGVGSRDDRRALRDGDIALSHGQVAAHESGLLGLSRCGRS